MNDVHIELPFPPTVNSYYGHTKRGIKYITKNGKSFREACAEQCLHQNAYNLKLDYPLQVDVILYPPDKRQRDLDNYMKALLDALTLANVWEDDSLIDGLTIHRGKLTKGGKCAVRVAEHHGFICPDSPDVWDVLP